MTTNTGQRTLLLVGLVGLVAAMLLVAFAGPASASEHSDLEIENQSIDAETNHNWTYTPQGETTVERLELNYTFPSVDVTAVDSVIVEIDGDPKTVDDVESESDIIAINLSDPHPVNQGENVELLTTDEQFVHPSFEEPGQFADFKLYDSTEAEFPINATFQEVVTEAPTGTLNGTVTNATSGAPIEDATVTALDQDNIGLQQDTNADGEYEFSELETGEYTVSVDPMGYEETSEEDVTITEDETETVDLAADPIDGGTVNVTVVEPDGVTPVEDAWVEVFDDMGETFQFGETDEDGEVEILVPEDDYTVRADKDGFAQGSETGVGVVEGEETNVTVELEEAATIDGTVTDADDDSEIEGATVDVYDDHYTVHERTTTDGSGEYSVDVPAGEYTVEVDADGYGPSTETGVEVDTGGTETQDVELDEPATFTGTVTYANGTDADNVFVVATDGSSYFFNQTDTSGEYTIEVPDGEYSLEAYDDGEMGSSDDPISIEVGDTETVDLEMVDPQVVHTDLEQADGQTSPEMGNIDLETFVMGGFMQVQLIDTADTPGEPSDLEDRGVEDETRFEITLSVEDFAPNSLLWGAKDLEWSTETNATDSNVTDVTIETNPVNLQAIDPGSMPIGLVDDYSDIDWPSGANDQATEGYNQSVFFGLFDLSNVPGGFADELNGMTVTTNAQVFSRPQMTDSGLEVYVGAPHLTEQGNQHDGFYDAFIPDAQLDDWGVDDPEADLNALWQGESSDFTVDDSPSDGVWIELDITYSAGTLTISPDDESDGPTDSPTGPQPSDADDDDADDDDADDDDADDDDADDDDADDEEADGDDADDVDDEDVEDTDDADDADDEDADDADDAVDDDADDAVDDDPTATDDAADDTPADDRDADTVPGFGVLVGLLALLAVTLALRVRTSG